MEAVAQRASQPPRRAEGAARGEEARVDAGEDGGGQGG